MDTRIDILESRNPQTGEEFARLSMNSPYPSNIAVAPDIESAVRLLGGLRHNGVMVPAENRPEFAPELERCIRDLELCLQGTSADFEGALQRVSKLLESSSGADCAVELIADMRRIAAAVWSVTDGGGFMLRINSPLWNNFHDDTGVVVATVAYHGSGMDFLSDDDAMWGRDYKVWQRPDSRIFSADTNDVLVQRGSFGFDPPRSGLAHRWTRDSQGMVFTAYGALDKSKLTRS